jgi:4-alpha-glucanotransferase
MRATRGTRHAKLTVERRNPHRILDRRRAGVVLHPTSLPGGNLGADAFRFADFLAAAGFSVWQMLPLGPTHPDRSPYHCLSAHAASPELICVGRLVDWGWLTAAQLSAERERGALLQAARAALKETAGGADWPAVQAFGSAESYWLDDFTLYLALRAEQGGSPWWQWPAPLRDRDAAALAAARTRLAAAIEQTCFEQYVFQRQWRELRAHAAARGVLLFGDAPIFVAHDSADVWAHRHCFKLDGAGQPTVVAGVPPDYFSATGQRWGNPLYDWDAMQDEDFAWWTQRVHAELQRFDLIRIDHFRGFEACWEIPVGDATAVNGHWVKTPGEALFAALHRQLGNLPLVAEDLGFITAEVHALREHLAVPGMSVLQFAFDGGADNPYLPHHHKPNSVVYTGTHDNDTSLSWFEGLAAETQLRVVEYLGYQHEPMPWPLIRAALASVARLAVLPMQDLLGLGRGHRMNTPGTTSGNWDWRFEWEQLAPDLTARLRRMNQLYGRV